MSLFPLLLPKYRSGPTVTWGLVCVVWEEREMASREYWEASPEIFLVRIWACSLQVAFPMAQNM